MGFDLFKYFADAVAALNPNAIAGKAQDWLAENGAKYPDAKELTDKLAAFLGTTIAEAAPNLDPATLRDTLYGVASDIIRGTSGVDPQAGHITG